MTRNFHWFGSLALLKQGVTFEQAQQEMDAIGARIAYQAGDLKRSRMKVGGGSFLSSHDPRLVLGTGKQSKVAWLEVRWPQPSGVVERFTDLPIDRYITIVEGTGKWQ